MPSNDLVVRLMGDAGDFERALKSAQQSASVFERELAKADQRQIASVAHVTRMRTQYEQEAAREAATAARTSAQAKEQAARASATAATEAAEAEQEALQTAAQGAVVSGAAIAAGLALSARAAIDWESAWAGVTKTVDGGTAEMGALEAQLRGLATVLPATHTEIAAVAEAAGQLGVKREAIAGFTKTMIDLGVTTNLSAEEAATAVAQMANIMGTSISDVDRLAATLVALGNAGASTEADILAMSVRLAGAGSLVDATEADVLALANALASMGIEAELGGGATSRTLTKIYAAVKDGGTQLQTFADVAGMSAEQFAAAFETSPIRALDSFVQGLGQIDQAGGNVVAALDELGISGTQDLQVLLRLKGAGDLLTQSLDLGAAAWEANTALLKEADARYATTEAQMQVAKNAVNELAIDLGTTLLPALAAVIGGVTDFARWLADLPEPVQRAAVVVATLSAGILLVSGAATLAAPRLLVLKGVIDALVGAAIRAAWATGTLSASLSTVLVAAAAITIGVDQVVKALADAPPSVDELTQSIEEFTKSGQVSGALAKSFGEDLSQLGEQLDRAGQRRFFSLDFGTTQSDIVEAQDGFKALDSTLVDMVNNGNAEGAAKLYAEASRQALLQGRTVEELGGRLKGYMDVQRTANAQTKSGTEKAYEQADALVATSEVLGRVTPGLGEFAKSQKLSEEATQALIERVKDWGKVLAAFVNPLGAYTDLLGEASEAERASAEKGAQVQNEAVEKKIKAVRREYDQRLDTLRATKGVSDKAVQLLEDERDATVDSHEKSKKSWQDYAKAVSVSVEDYLRELEAQVKAQQDWQTNMLILSSKVGPEVLEMFRQMGPEGANLLAQFVNASDAELARLAPIARSRTEQFTAAMGQTQIQAGPLLAHLSGQLGQKMVAELAHSLASGQTTVGAIMEVYGLTIENGIIVPLDRASSRLSGFEAELAGLDGFTATAFVDVEYRSSGTDPTRLPPGGPMKAFADGGLIEGPGTGTSDEVPIWASDHEFVQQEKAVRYYGVKFMEDVNNLRLPRPEGYARGGLISAMPMPAVPVMTMPTASPGAGGPQQVITHDRRVTVEKVIAADWRDMEAQIERRERLAALSSG